MGKRETIEEFISKARAVHGERYDYSEVVLTGNQNKVKVICSVHGCFNITPGHHKSGKGCRKCATERNSEACRELWVDYEKEVTRIHNGKYTYEQPTDKYRPLRINVNCDVHGVFNTLTSSHKTGKGCRKCATAANGARRLDTLEQFIAKSRAIHGNKYDYSLVALVNDVTKVDIVCPHHGKFSVAPYSHKQGVGCKDCGDIQKSVKQQDTLDDFLYKAKLAHGDKYTYEKVANYSGDYVKVEITCPTHGSFWQTPSAHKVGKCCNKCQSAGYSQANSGSFYILTCGDITKVGITNKAVKERARHISSDSQMTFRIHSSIHYEDGSKAFLLERKALAWLRENYQGVEQQFNGYTECFLNVEMDHLLDFVIPLS